MTINAETSEIVGVVLTPNGEGDPSQVAPLLAQVKGPIRTVIADGAYDGAPTYRTVAARDKAAIVVIPPRATAVTGPTAESAPTQRDQHLKIIAEQGRMAWQKEVGYGRRALAETGMGRYKGVIGNRLHARSWTAQQAEAGAAAAALNRMIQAGRPDSVRRD